MPALKTEAAPLATSKKKSVITNHHCTHEDMRHREKIGHSLKKKKCLLITDSYPELPSS